MVWSQEEIDAFKARRAQGEGNLGKVDEFVSGGWADHASGGKKNMPSLTRGRATPVRKHTSTPTEKSHVVDDWLGSPITAKRSWKVKSTKSPLPAGMM